MCFLCFLCVSHVASRDVRKKREASDSSLFSSKNDRGNINTRKSTRKISTPKCKRLHGMTCLHLMWGFLQRVDFTFYLLSRVKELFSLSLLPAELTRTTDRDFYLEKLLREKEERKRRKRRRKKKKEEEEERRERSDSAEKENGIDLKVSARC